MNNAEVTRQVAVSAKATELQGEIERWAIESNILSAGERLVFSLRIEGMPIVMQEEVGNVWEMSPDDFFASRRLHSQGVPHPLAVRISNCIKNIGFYEYGSKSSETLTMRGFLADFDQRRLLRQPNMGPKGVEEIARILKLVGMTLQEG